MTFISSMHHMHHPGTLLRVLYMTLVSHHLRVAFTGGSNTHPNNAAAASYLTSGEPLLSTLSSGAVMLSSEVGQGDAASNQGQVLLYTCAHRHLHGQQHVRKQITMFTLESSSKQCC
jgi:hypothetical protein